MKRRIAFSLIIALAAGTAIAATKAPQPKAWTQEPDSFMGIRFDQKIEYSLPQCPKTNPVPTDLCRDQAYGKLVPVKGLPDIGLSYRYDLSVFPNPTGIDSFFLTASPKDFERLIEIFTTKYGKPTDQGSSTVKTKAGAEFVNQMLSWDGKSVSILMQKYNGDINTSSVSIRTNASVEQSAGSRANAIKSGASKL